MRHTKTLLPLLSLLVALPALAAGPSRGLPFLNRVNGLTKRQVIARVRALNNKGLPYDRALSQVLADPAERFDVTKFDVQQWPAGVGGHVTQKTALSDDMYSMPTVTAHREITTIDDYFVDAAGTAPAVIRAVTSAKQAGFASGDFIRTGVSSYGDAELVGQLGKTRIYRTPASAPIVTQVNKTSEDSYILPMVEGSIRAENVANDKWDSEKPEATIAKLADTRVSK